MIEWKDVSFIYSGQESDGLQNIKLSIFALSGGEKQKIAFASVYAMNPEVYLLDEPSSNLDMDSIQALKEHLTLIKAQGKTILIAEHRLYYLMAVAGHNGTGKTTFSRALCGLHKGCEGEFLWEGQTLDAKARRKRSYLVMQDVGYQLFAESVEKECVFGIKSPDTALAKQTLDGLGLSDFREKHPNTLSGGQKQRLAVAVSMVCGKDILVFDEPTSGLDYDSMTQVAALMDRLAQAGGILFVVTHDYELVCRACTRVLHFDEGEMPDDLLVTRENEGKIRQLFGIQP